MEGMSPEAAKMIGAGIAIFSLFGIGLGMSFMFATWLKSIARNPSVDDKLKFAGIMGLALIESIALLAFIIACLMLYK